MIARFAPILAFSGFLALLAAQAGAQAPGIAVAEPAAARTPDARSTRYALPRVFYSPGQRRERELAEAGIFTNSPETADHPADTAGVRFDGWLAGPAGTHTWINGNRTLANAPRAGEPAHFDARTHQLIVADQQGRDVHLKAGESLDQEPGPSLERP